MTIQKRNNGTAVDLEAINAALSLLSSLTAKDLLAIQWQRAIKAVPSMPTTPALQVRRTLTEEEKRQRKNERQRLSRSTPEGRAYANEASRKSLAAKKRAEEVKAFMAERVKAYFDAVAASAAHVPTTATKKDGV